MIRIYRISQSIISIMSRIVEKRKMIFKKDKKDAYRYPKASCRNGLVASKSNRRMRLPVTKSFILPLQSLRERPHMALRWEDVRKRSNDPRRKALLLERIELPIAPNKFFWELDRSTPLASARLEPWKELDCCAIVKRRLRREEDRGTTLLLRLRSWARRE